MDAAWREMRAVQASALPPAVARLVDRYSEALRASRPLGASFGIRIAPGAKSKQRRVLRTRTDIGSFGVLVWHGCCRCRD